MMQTPDDNYYVDLLRNGDQAAFKVLVVRHQNFVFSLCLKLLQSHEEAEEVCQDVFIKVFHSIHQFKQNARFTTWLYRIAWNTSINRKESLRRLPHYEELGDQNLDIDDLSSGLDLLEAQDRKEIVAKSIARLAPKDQAVVILYYYEDQSVKEIAEIVDESASNVKIRLYRSRKQLLSSLAKLQPELGYLVCK